MPTRRQFIEVSTAGMAAFAGRQIFPSLNKHKNQIKIAKVEAFAVRRAIYARVTADEGTTGWGECGHSGGRLVAEVVNRELDDLIIGMDVFDTEPAWARMFYEIDELGPGGLASQALAGVDCALWDLRGKLLGLPVWKLLGGKFRDTIPLYGSFSRSKGGGAYRTPVECARYAAELQAEGFRALKIRLAIREENQDPMNDPAIPVMQEVRSAVGDEMELYVDANNGYSPSRAITIGKELEERYNVSLFEEPVAAYQYPSLAKVAEALDMPVSGGEHEYTRWAFRDLILHGKVDVLNPDLSKLGGLTEGKKVSTLAEVFDLPISVHNARPTLLTAAHLHYIASSQMAHRYQEHPGKERLKELWQYFENRIEVVDGNITVPDAPGLGLVVNEKAVREAAE